MEMTSLQSWVNRSPVFESIDLKETQYQAWLYVVEIDRVTEWLPVLNGMINISLYLKCFIALTKYATTSF
jgi:hypothetical protein